MACFTSASDFKKWQDSLRVGLDPKQKVVTICGGTGCTAFGAPVVQEAFVAAIAQAGVQDRVSVKTTGCHGFCEMGPVVVIHPEKFFYSSVQVEDVPEIVEKTVLGGKFIERLSYVDPATQAKVALDHEVPFYEKQQRLVFRLNGLIDPTSLEDYVAHDGYAAAIKAISEMTPESVIEEVREAGLRGRGGAGFSTGLKWDLARKSPGDQKYMICNADEGDPGAFMDRSILEGTPHAVIEGMLISAYAIGATKGIIYVRAEYPLAVKNTALALEAARDAGLLGENILGTGITFDIEIREGAGAFVCGEETALIASLEGQRGMPRPRPPFPVQKGYTDKPTCINNVETLANVSLIVLNGKDWYRGFGTEKSPGTKIFALAGKVNNTGLVEVPMGTTLRELVFDIGGGIPKGGKFKAAQMGGPSGGCVPAQYLDLPIDYDSVREIGAIMGSGGLIVMDESTCMVDLARYFLTFAQDESCGKCTPCRVGTKLLLEMLESICNGTAEMDVLDKLQKYAVHIQQGSLCGLGQTAPNPVLSTLQYFREEYEEHIQLKHCRAAVCEGLVYVSCQHACPANVNVPEYVGLIAEHRLDEAADIIRRRNPFVSICGRVCDHPCEQRCRRSLVDEPVAIRSLKKYVADNMENYDRLLAPLPKGEVEVAIVGAGPAGLTCAFFLALMGRKSIIFEAAPIPGGMLSLGIPEYRLPKSVLSKEIDYILSHGIELRTNTPVEDIRQLQKDGYKAIFVATGAHVGRNLRLEGEDLEGVIDGLRFLRDYALEQANMCENKRVVVIGGGNAALDAARSAIRLGASQVTVLYRRTREEMPAYEEEIEEALLEGVELHALAIPNSIVGKDGRVTGIEWVQAKLGDADSSGRRRPVAVEGSESITECDVIIPAVGQKASIESVSYEQGPKLTSWGTIIVDPVSLATSEPGIFAAGDIVTGGTTVVEAIAGGQKAAVTIDRFLGGAGQLPPDSGMSFARPDEDQLRDAADRVEENSLTLHERKLNFDEVIQKLDRDQAVCEAQRCLRCDLEKNCNPKK
jgi:NADH-quinone oxidoreductase subunit F